MPDQIDPATSADPTTDQAGAEVEALDDAAAQAAPPPADACLAPLFHGRAALVERYGRLQVQSGAIVTPRGWEARFMGRAQLPGYARAVYLNRDVIDRAVDLFSRWEARRIAAEADRPGSGYVIRSVGFFAPRAKRGRPDLLSLHSYGIAFDLNPDRNPMRAPMVTDIPAAYLDDAEACGWYWGGRFPTPDPMHFQQAWGV